jgi:hypothetical protein
VGIDWEKVYESMNKPAFVFDGRLIVDAEKLTKIGFKVSGLHVCGAKADDGLQVTMIGRPQLSL